MNKASIFLYCQNPVACIILENDVIGYHSIIDGGAPEDWLGPVKFLWKFYDFENVNEEYIEMIKDLIYLFKKSFNNITFTEPNQIHGWDDRTEGMYFSLKCNMNMKDEETIRFDNFVFHNHKLEHSVELTTKETFVFLSNLLVYHIHLLLFSLDESTMNRSLYSGVDYYNQTIKYFEYDKFDKIRKYLSSENPNNHQYVLMSYTNEYLKLVKNWILSKEIDPVRVLELSGAHTLCLLSNLDEVKWLNENLKVKLLEKINSKTTWTASDTIGVAYIEILNYFYYLDINDMDAFYTISNQVRTIFPSDDIKWAYGPENRNIGFN